MRKLSVAVAVLLVAGLVPLAGAASNIEKYTGSIVIEEAEGPDNLVVNPISFRPTDDQGVEFFYDLACVLTGACGNDNVPHDVPDVYDGRDTNGGDGPVWLHVNGQDTHPYQVSIETDEPVVGTVDVYEYHGNDGGDHHTPKCPWEVAYRLYPDDGQPIASTDYLVHLQTVTLGSHGVEAAGVGPLPGVGSHLTLPGSVDGYIVAIDARVASGATETLGANEVTGGNETATLDYKISSDTRFDVQQVPNHWIYSPWTLERNITDCPQEGVDLPNTESLAAEIPGSGDQISFEDLVGTALPTS